MPSVFKLLFMPAVTAAELLRRLEKFYQVPWADEKVGVRLFLWLKQTSGFLSEQKRTEKKYKN